MATLSQLLFNAPVLKVSDFQGIFEMGKTSDVFYRLLIEKRYESNLAELCTKYLNPKKDAIDVGANIGLFTVLLAKNLPSRKVLAIEPECSTKEILLNNLTRNNVLSNVIISEKAISNKCCKMLLKTIPGKEEYSTIGLSQHPGTLTHKYTEKIVPCDSLDNLCKEKEIDPGIIKIDVEGMEHLVFEGAKSILQNNRPIIISELSNLLLKANGSSAKKVIGMITSNNYNVFDANFPRTRPGSKDFGDIICFPNEMNIDFK